MTFEVLLAPASVRRSVWILQVLLPPMYGPIPVAWHHPAALFWLFAVAQRTAGCVPSVLLADSAGPVAARRRIAAPRGCFPIATFRGLHQRCRNRLGAQLVVVHKLFDERQMLINFYPRVSSGRGACPARRQDGLLVSRNQLQGKDLADRGLSRISKLGMNAAQPVIAQEHACSVAAVRQTEWSRAAAGSHHNSLDLQLCIRVPILLLDASDLGFA